MSDVFLDGKSVFITILIYGIFREYIIEKLSNGYSIKIDTGKIFRGEVS